MSTVAKVCQAISQPRGGLLPLKLFDEKDVDKEKELSLSWNIHHSLVRNASISLANFVMRDAEEAFAMLLSGADAADIYRFAPPAGYKSNGLYARSMLSELSGVNNDSARISVKMASYFVCAMNKGKGFVAPYDIVPDETTLSDICTITNRIVSFFNNNGPIIGSELRVDVAYTSQAWQGEVDYLTQDSVWDLRLIKTKPRISDTLQILTYYVLSKRSKSDIFNRISGFGLYNPITSKSYYMSGSFVTSEMEDFVMSYVMGYGHSYTSYKDRPDPVISAGGKRKSFLVVVNGGNDSE